MKRHWRRQGAPGINNRELNQAAFDASWLAMAETALFSITIQRSDSDRRSSIVVE
jgi:hypothetical protein